MRVVSWNVNRRVGQGFDRQVEALSGCAPDLAALQELTTTTSAAWCEALTRLGLPHHTVGFEQATEALADRRRGRSTVLLASRWPLQTTSGIAAPWRERTASAVVEAPFGPVEVHTVYVPTVSTGPEIGRPLLKVETFEAIYQRMAQPSAMPRLLCGDFNAPYAELEDGTVVPFGRRGRAATAELSVMQQLVQVGLVDVFRVLHGYGVSAFSWRGRRNDYRIDHVFASRSLVPARCAYRYDVLEARLSDHAAVEIAFEPSAAVSESHDVTV
jgi:exonuclease III